MPASPRDVIARRAFLARTGVGGFVTSSATLPAVFASQKPEDRPLRVIAYNIYACAGWPHDRPLAKRAVAKGQMAERLSLELALYDPDIINFSESPSEAVVRQIAERLAMHYVRFPSGGNWPGTLLSRYEIVESANVPLAGRMRPAELFTRHWGRAVIRLDDGEPLIVHSAHLHPAPAPEIRLREIREMIRVMRPDLEAQRSMLLLGDLNHTPTPPEYPLWEQAGWVDTFAKVGQGEGFTIKADRPSRRIDYVLAAGPIAERVVESRPLFEGAFRVNTADPNAFALSDHLPQLAVFRMPA